MTEISTFETSMTAKLILFNKPFKVLSQFEDEDNRDTLKKYIQMKKVYPAGRLDYDSEGLMLLTDCGKLQHKISHPKQKMPKTYWVQVENIPSEIDLDKIRQGLTIKGLTFKKAEIKIIDEPSIWPRKPPIRQRNKIPTCWLEIIIVEGKNRQVRRMTAAIGFPTLRLIRAKIGQWSLDDLQPGQFRPYIDDSNSLTDL